MLKVIASLAACLVIARAAPILNEAADPKARVQRSTETHSSYGLMDGCSSNTASDFDTRYGSQRSTTDTATAAGEVQCCSTDGSTCTRMDASNSCASGAAGASNPFSPDSAADAEDLCSALGMRLCETQAELDKCCGSGCQYDNALVWAKPLTSSSSDAFVSEADTQDLLGLIDSLSTASSRQLVAAVKDGDYYQARVAACKVLSPAENVLSKFISELARTTDAAVEVGFSTAVTAVFFNAAWGLSLIWGEDGQFACAENTQFGADLELLGASVGVGVSISPTRFMGGWKTVGAEMNNPDVCVSVTFTTLGGVGIAGTMQINPDRSIFGSDGLNSESGRARIAEAAQSAVADATTGAMTEETLLRAIFDGLQFAAGALGATSVGVEAGVDVGVLDQALKVFTGGASTALPGITVGACAQELIHCEGAGCSDKVMLNPWDDGTLCGLGSTCTKCNNPATYWYSKAMTACGDEPKWSDGTLCGVGTSCNACQNSATYWWSKALTACGTEAKWSDGTLCALGTTCNQCENSATYWPAAAATKCGNEPCWTRNSYCGAGTTCNSCCNGHHWSWAHFFTVCK